LLFKSSKKIPSSSSSGSMMLVGAFWHCASIGHIGWELALQSITGLHFIMT
jgi:hypothetical protein